MPGAGVDVLAGVECVANTEARRRAGHELHQADGAAAGDRARVELGLDRDHGRDERGGNSVARRCALYVRGDRRRGFTIGEPPNGCGRGHRTRCG